MIDLHDYFANTWRPALTTYSNSKYENIANNINDNEYLLDVGCGDNPFKSLVKNCHGIDPYNALADEQVSIEEFVPSRLYNVATCLGSINFGTDETYIAQQIEKVVSCLTPSSRIYWRVNPGRRDHSTAECMHIDFFPWTFTKLRKYAELHGYTQTNEHYEDSENVLRLYAEWHR